MPKKPKLGSGGRFKAGAKKMESEGMSKHEADAIMAKSGRKKYGAKKMAAMSAHGRSKKK